MLGTEPCATITLRQAQRLALHASLLHGQPQLALGKAGVADLIGRLGYVQIDTIHVLQRAHLHTLWTRLADFRAKDLHQLQAVDRNIFEYWAHAMCYLPMEDFRYFRPRMKRYERPSDTWTKDRLERVEHLLPMVLKRIKEEGPLGAADFKTPEKRKSSGWWDWKPAKSALELLFWQGKLMISERKNFSRRYDLTERVLPKSTNKKMPNQEQLATFLIDRALSAMGIATLKEIVQFYHHIGKQVDIAPVLQKAVGAKTVLPVAIKTLKGPYYVLPPWLERLSTLKTMPQRVHILSPFDNFAIQRDRMRKLFDFDYVLECYLPQSRRKFGYFVLPIMVGQRFMGRMDCKAERARSELVVKNLFLEPSFRPGTSSIKSFLKKLDAFASFNACDTVRIEHVYPKAHEPMFKT
ncbi:MAG: YcaQ family DNA glycosylase [Deltaproteobacteria bacterium]|nr:YcaQ family DNA glycosylase [Deltaproteobacteria bacterium]